MERSEVINLLQSHGVRPTSNRIIIAETLAMQSRPVSLIELEDIIDSIDKSVIFRTLSLFRESHLVHTIEDGSDSLRFELCKAGDNDHDNDVHVHFYCEKCKKTYCLEEIAVPKVSLPDGYEQRSVNYLIKGICPSCGNRW